MLRGEKVILRARHAGDIAVLEAGLYADVAAWSRASAHEWRPLSPGSAMSPYRIRDADDDSGASFSVVDAASGDLAGEAVLWSIDRYNRFAHLGLALLPDFRGRGLGTDVARVLCRYAFETLGLHRVQLETLADNDGMIGAARRAGFRQEGQFTESAWVNGQFADEVIYALLAAEWRSANQPGSA